MMYIMVYIVKFTVVWDAIKNLNSYRTNLLKTHSNMNNSFSNIK